MSSHQARSIWIFPLQDQLEPQFYGCPRSSKSEKDLRMERDRIPKLDATGFKTIFPGDEQCTICVVQKTHARYYVYLQEAATWIINATHWFNALQQPMMVVMWCRDWNDASEFQYLMQMLQVTLEDYDPKWQIFVQYPETVQRRSSIGSVQQPSGKEFQYWASWRRPI